MFPRGNAQDLVEALVLCVFMGRPQKGEGPSALPSDVEASSALQFQLSGREYVDLWQTQYKAPFGNWNEMLQDSSRDSTHFTAFTAMVSQDVYQKVGKKKL